MKTLRSFAILAAAASLGAASLLAQQPASPRVNSTGGKSPHETTSAVIGDRKTGDRVTITYGRPYTKDPKTGEPRKIWGGLVPYGKVWRTGANEATLLVTQAPLQFGDTTVPAGAYTLWTIPNEDGAKLIINKQIGQWGEARNEKDVYDEANDVVRVDMKKETLDKPVDQFSISIGKEGADGGVIKLAWENTAYSAPFTVKK
jgi:hypothetical protein